MRDRLSHQHFIVDISRALISVTDDTVEINNFVRGAKWDLTVQSRVGKVCETTE